MLQTETKELELNGKKYILHKFPATVGREIITQYPVSNIPKIGNYQESEKVMLKALAHIGVVVDGGKEILLETKELVDNHVQDAITLMKLEKAVLQFSFDFLADGEISRYLNIVLKVADKSLTGMLTALLGTSSVQEEQHSEN